jgi:hypothetical protein
MEGAAMEAATLVGLDRRARVPRPALPAIADGEASTAVLCMRRAGGLRGSDEWRGLEEYGVLGARSMYVPRSRSETGQGFRHRWPPAPPRQVRKTPRS